MFEVEQIRKLFEEKLNLNDQGILFRVFTYEKALDKRYESDNQGNKQEFVPSIITTPLGSYLPMNDIKGMRLSFNIEILLPYKFKEQWTNMLDSFIYEVNGKVFYYGRETKVFYEEREYNPTEGYTIVKFSCQVPSFGAVGPQNFEVIKDVATYLPISKTENYIAINVPVAVKTSENVHIGDEAGLYIAEPYDDADNIWVESDDAEALFLKLQKENCLEYAYVDVLGEFASAAAMVTYYNANNTTYDPTLYAVAKALKTGTTEYLYIKTDCHIATAEFYKLKAIDKGNQNPRLVETNHFESQTTSESLIKENSTNWVVNAYYEVGNTILDNIVYNLASGDDMNHIYWVKMLLPNGRAIYRSCVIISNVANFPTDDFATLPLTFTKAME